ncbi:MAG: (Fe-S)-binding protein, partial [Sulfolobales archaeon]
IAVLGDQELCCGDPLRRIGEESRFQDIALKNIQLLKSLGVKRIVTICPHGYNVFKNEYRDIDPSFDIEVLHHSQLLAKLIEEGRIKPGARIEEPVTLHDSCYIARINRIVDEPRKIIRISSKEYREVRRSGFRTFCCGAGGANYWYDVPERKRISVERVEELVSTGSKVIVAECPFCIAMLEDALRNLGLDKSVRVRDLSEILRGGA